jgi:hypothetical protein
MYLPCHGGAVRQLVGCPFWESLGIIDSYYAPNILSSMIPNEIGSCHNQYSNETRSTPDELLIRNDELFII